MHVELAGVAGADENRAVELTLRQRAAAVRADVVERPICIPDARDRHVPPADLVGGEIAVGQLTRAPDPDELAHQANRSRSGTCLKPLTKFERIRRGAPVSSNAEIRGRSSSSMTRTSS